MRNTGVLVLLSYLIALAIALSVAVVSKPEGILFFAVVFVVGISAAVFLPRLATNRHDNGA